MAEPPAQEAGAFSRAGEGGGVARPASLRRPATWAIGLALVLAGGMMVSGLLMPLGVVPAPVPAGPSGPRLPIQVPAAEQRLQSAALANQQRLFDPADATPVGPAALEREALAMMTGQRLGPPVEPQASRPLPTPSPTPSMALAPAAPIIAEAAKAPTVPTVQAVASVPTAAPAMNGSANAVVAALATPPAAAPRALPADAPRIALLLIDYGGDPRQSRAALAALPPSVSLGLTPGLPNAREWVERARREGHEVWLGVPMEPQRYPAINPGPATLLLRHNAAEVSEMIDRQTREAAGVTGIFNVTGSAFTRNADALGPVMAALDAKRLAFFDTRSSGETVGVKVARAKGVAAALNDQFIEDGQGPWDRQFTSLERKARQSGAAAAVVRTGPEGVNALARWLAGVSARGVDVVPLSTLTQPRGN